MNRALAISIAIGLSAAGGAALAGGGADAGPAGATLYAERCAACHMPHGGGIEDFYPALAGNAAVEGDVEPLLTLIARGRGAMPPFLGDLSPAELAAVTSYIRTSWGNGGSAVTPERARRLLSGRSQAIDRGREEQF